MIEAKWLKPVNGFYIDKSWETKEDGTIKKDSVIYTVYDDPEGNFIECFSSLKDAKAFCKKL